MEYEELYKYICDMIDESIDNKDSNEHKKIYDIIINWYKNNYEESLKNLLEAKKEKPLLGILKKIKEICLLNDSEKIIFCSMKDDIKEIIDISSEIYNLAINNRWINEDTYNSYLNKINEIENNTSESYKNIFLHEKSESLLDLQYLLNKGNIQEYSLRISDYINFENKV